MALDIEKVKPSRGMMLVMPIPKKKLSEGGIILSDKMVRQEFEYGKVLRLGEPYRHVKSGVLLHWDIKVGDVIGFPCAAGTEIATSQGKALLLFGTEPIVLQDTCQIV